MSESASKSPSKVPQSARKSPRVALFLDTDAWAGTESHLLELARGLREIGAPVILAVRGASPLAIRARHDGLDVLSMPHGARAVRTLSRALKSRRIDIVHAHNGRTALIGALAVARARHGHLVLTQHFLAPAHLGHSSLKARLFRGVHRRVNARAGAFIAISQAVRDAMIERGDAPQSNVTVVFNGLQPPSPSGASSESVRDALGVAADAPLVVCVARLEREKDIATLIAAMRIVVDALPSARCAIAGQGALREELANQIKDCRLENAVTLAGFVDNVADLIVAADLFVLPSRAEPFGLVLLEAMGLERPVVAVNEGGPREIVRDGETGLLVAPAAPIEMAQAIGQLLNDPIRAREMGRAGRERFESHFTRGHMARGALDVYLRVVDG